jgi:hypothetical protein
MKKLLGAESNDLFQKLPVTGYADPSNVCCLNLRLSIAFALLIVEIITLPTDFLIKSWST